MVTADAITSRDRKGAGVNQVGRESLLSGHRTANQTRSNSTVWPSGRVAEHNKLLKGLILAQNERWRPGLGMQVERTQQWGAA
jgi:hypothetical protein